MDPQVRTSFIPKKPITAAAPVRRGGVGVFFLIGLIVFLASLIAAGASFGYLRFLTQSIASKSASLERARGAFEPAVVEELIRLDNRMRFGSQVLGAHIAPSAIFALLERGTLASVRFKSFDYALESEGKAVISLGGEARSFSDIALQSDTFGENRALRDLFFSNINIDQGGIVVFTMRAIVDPSLLAYTAPLAPAGETP